MSTRMQQRRGTATQWLSLNEGQGPILAAGEIGFESDTNKFKIGDGVNHWVDLAYFADVAGATEAGTGLWETAPGVLAIDDTVATLEDPQTFKNKGINFAENSITATLAELNTSITDANLATISGTESLQNKTLLTPTINDATISGADITGGTIDVPSLRVSGTDVSLSTDLSSHASDTTNVHGIENTADLATQAYVDNAVSNSAVDQSTLAGVGLDWNVTTSQFDVGTLDNPTISSGLTLDGTGDFTISADANIILDAATEVYIGSAASGNEVLTTSGIANKQDKVSGVSDTEIGYLDGVTSKIQDQLDEKLSMSAASSTYQEIVSGVSNTEVGYLNGVTSSIQDQIDAKSPLANPTFTGTLNATDVIISGDLTVSGTTTSVSATNLEITDPLIYIGTGNTANLNDLGFVGHFDNGTYQHTGIVRDATDGKWKLFSGVTTEPSDVIDFTDAVYDTLKVGTLEGSAALTGTPTAPTAAYGTSTTQIATTEYVQEDNKVSYVSESGTTLTVSKASHMFNTIHCTSSSSVTVSIPTDASDDWPIGSYVNIRQMGTGQITFAAATPATTTVVATDDQFKTRVRYSEVVLEKIAANSWILVGDTVG
jgi:hypothetical protein